MAKIDTYENYPEEYDAWFDKHEWAYKSELAAVQALLPEFGDALEVGVGTGRFAVPLGIKKGIDPSARMLDIARLRGLDADEGVCEKLPYADASFDLVLIVTALWLADDPRKCLSEIHRVLRPGGYVLVGFVDRESALGRKYEEKRDKSRFYADARLLSADEILSMLDEAGFSDVECVQTLFKDPAEVDALEPVKPGWGEGSFVVMRGEKKG